MIVLTGAAGFIGSCLLAELNRRGHSDIIIVDEAEKSQDFPNLRNKKFSQFLDKQAFLYLIEQEKLSQDVEVIFHLGACSSTTLDDEDYFIKNNFQYSLKLAQYAQSKNIRFIYASSGATYGDGSQGFSDDNQTTLKLKPLNLYGLSKQNFDLWIIKQELDKTSVGLKYFNVYGPNEYHKGDMQSLICKSFDSVVREKKMRLFRSHRREFEDGGQKRDFIFVLDAVRATLFFWDNPKRSGIFNIGTGKARTWNDLANALFAALDIKPKIEYIPLPTYLEDKYQYFTQADIKKLKSSGFNCKFMSLEEGIKNYVKYLKNKAYL